MWCIRSFRYACASQLIPVIHFDPLSSVRLLMNTRLISPLHTTNVHSIPFRSRKLLPILSISWADENGWSHPRNFARPLCPFCIRFVSIGQWDRACSSKTLCADEITVDGRSMDRSYETRRQWVYNGCIAFFQRMARFVYVLHPLCIRKLTGTGA